MKRVDRLMSIAAAGLTGAATGSVTADIGPVAVNGKLATIIVEGEPPSQMFGGPERVFAEELTFDAMTGVGVEGPGFASAPDNPILGATLQYNITAALRRWDGSAFAATAWRMSTGSDEAMLPFILTPTTDMPTPAYAFNLDVDQHFDWRLEGATETSGQGVYLVSLTLSNPGGALLESEPIWIVFNYGRAEEEHATAIAWTRENLAPAPGVACVPGAWAVLWARRNRRAEPNGRIDVGLRL